MDLLIGATARFYLLLGLIIGVYILVLLLCSSMYRYLKRNRMLGEWKEERRKRDEEQGKEE